jgi:hypothetical protein
MGGHVGGDTSLRELREKPLAQLIEENKEKGKVYMIHLADDSFLSLFAADAIHLLGQDRFGLPLKKE